MPSSSATDAIPEFASVREELRSPARDGDAAPAIRVPVHARGLTLKILAAIAVVGALEIAQAFFVSLLHVENLRPVAELPGE